jgi:hypothetical protein
LKIFSIFILVLLSLNSPLSCFPGTKFQYTPQNDSLYTIEKVYLHVDRESYYPGEDIWFKAYLTDAATSLISSNSINLHVELISPDLKIIDSRVMKLDNGMVNGDFHLSEKLQSGRYRLRAYTNYMRNFGDQLFFNKDITIINSSDAAKAFSDTVSYDRNKPDITFFPEGGSLVENVTSIVAFKAVDDHGYAQNVSGEIFSSTGEQVADFKSTHNGMGLFSLTPAPGLKYFALIINHNGDTIKYELPKSFPKGVVLNISNNQAGQLSLIFKTNPETFPLVTANDLSVTVSVRNAAFKTYSFRMKSLNSFFNLPTDDLPDGIVMLTLSGADNIPLCERLAFIRNKDEVKVKVKVETEKTEYKQRDSVSLKVSLLVNSTIPQDAYLSLSATDNFFTDNSSGFPSTISSWFLLESDVHGPVEEPSYYFDPSNPDRLKDLDLLLLTQGWRDFEWKYKTMIYPPENGFTISGKVRKKFAEVPLKNVKVNISIFKIGNPLTTIVLTDGSGKFSLNGVDLTGNGKVVVSVTDEKDNLKGWLLIDSARYSPALIKDSITQKKFIHNYDQNTSEDQIVGENMNIGQNLSTFIQHAEFKNSVEKKYKLSDTITPGEVNIVAKRDDAPESARKRSIHYLMGTPDKEIIVTPESKIYNDVYKLLVSKMILSPRERPLPAASQSHVMQNPLYLINGQIASKDEVKSLTVDVVERIDILRDMASYAIWGSGTGVPIDGVISIILKSDFAASRTSVFHSANVNFSGFNEPRIFYSPKHHTKLESDYKPDLRTTLFWEPNIKVENNKDIFLNYYNADNPSKVRVIVEGITTSGIPVTGKTEYEVK